MAGRRRRSQAVPNRAIGYARVSTDEQGQSGLGIEAQREAIRREASRRGFPDVAIYEDVASSGKNLRRPGLRRALSELRDGGAAVLIVSKLDRLTRSVHDASGVMQRAEREGWGLVALDIAVDTTTPQGAAMAQMLAVFAELERRMIGQRTRDALAQKRRSGARLGRPRLLPPSTVRRIVAARRGGKGWSEIARRLNSAGVPTAQGGRQWHPATVKAVYVSRTGEAA
jgi:DNA invertase Pin-like site-specific DNA recombinase